MQTTRVDVELGPRSYSILIGSGTLDHLGATLREHGLQQTNAFVITNPQVGASYFEPVRAGLHTAGFSRIARHNIAATEEGKSWEELSKACSALLAAFPGTADVPLVLLLGGGVVGDLGGFAAGVFRRGVPFVQIPTTLLAAVDSSVGGKVGVNLGGVKNIVGIFNQPRLVFCDLATLRTLSARERRSGMAEVIKYGAVCCAPLFAQLENGDLEKALALNANVLQDIVTQCVRLKAHVVAQDEFDKKGIRNVLNFGHTFGHALELSASDNLTHGEAISIGMVAATRLAIALGMCEASFLERLTGLLERAELPTTQADGPGLFERVLGTMQMDKKFHDGQNLFVLPTRAGAWEERSDVPWPLVHEALRSVLVPLL